MDAFSSTDKIFYADRTANKRWIFLCSLIALGVGVAVGIIIGRFAICDERDETEKEKVKEEMGVFLPGVPKELVQDEDPSIGDKLINAVSSDNIREYLRILSENPHVAGTPADYEQAKYIHDLFLEYGLDTATLTPYQVLLSYPNPDDPNFIQLLNASDHVQYQSPLREAILTPEENKSNVIPPFNAFSAAGDEQGELVYVNYGTVEDYAFLENNKSINVSGKIVISRYGKIFRGSKVKLAEEHGAKAIILYSDPADYTMGNTSDVYPDSWFLPPSGAQRGTVFTGSGEPTTPGYPAIETAYHLPINELEFPLPKIPAHPMGYGIAEKILRELDGEEVPEDWRGALNITYRYGQTFKNTGWKIRVKVSTGNSMRTTYNAIGIIKGNIEPDRYVIIGNHRDAWVFGAIDPSSGTAIMMELARVLGKMVKDKTWRPRRSIIFCSWGAEEYGLFGSTEWIEHYVKNLGARAVGYINVDVAVDGSHSIRGYGTPLMYDSMYKSTQKVPNPDETERDTKPTVYDKWLATSPWDDYNVPKISIPGSGSDYAPFRDALGLPLADFSYTYDTKKYKTLASYPLYHSVYETFYIVDNVFDPGFKYHRAIGQVWIEMTRHLADSLILPFNASDYSRTLMDLTSSLLKQYGELMRNNSIDTSLLEDVVANFSTTVKEFQDMKSGINLKDPFAIRRINDQLMNLNRAFIDPEGLPGRRLKRHVLFTESAVDVYAGSTFPGLTDAMFEIEKDSDQEKRWTLVKKHYSVVLFCIQSASSTLKDVTNFMYDY